jgi:hypothetical protein
MLGLGDAVAAGREMIGAPQKAGGASLLASGRIGRVDAVEPLRRLVDHADEAGGLGGGKIDLAVVVREIDDDVDRLGHGRLLRPQDAPLRARRQAAARLEHGIADHEGDEDQDHEDRKEDRKENLRNARGARGEAGEAKRACDQRDHEEDHRPFQHRQPSGSAKIKRGAARRVPFKPRP